MVGALGMAAVIKATEKSLKGGFKHKNNNKEEGITISFNTLAYQMYRFFNKARMIFKRSSANILPIKIIDKGTVVLPSSSNSTRTVRGRLSEKRKKHKPIPVARRPGLKRRERQGSDTLPFVNK